MIIMEAENEEGFSRVQHITIRYELDESSAEDTGFHSSDDRGSLVGNQQLLEDGQGAITNEDEFASIPSIIDNVENSMVTFNGIITTKRSLDETICVLSVDNNEDRSAEEHFEIVLEPGSEENSEGSNGLAQEIIVAKKSANEEVIEIDDTSEEETQNPVVSLECTLEQPELAKEESAVFTGDEHYSFATHIKRSEESEILFRAFEDAMDDWYSKLSVHGSLKDCEIMESARQLAQHFKFEFPDDVQWLRAFRNRQLLKNLDNNKISNKNRVKKRMCQRGGKISRTTKDKLASVIKKKRIQHADIDTLDDGYFKPSKEDLNESSDYPLMLRRALNADPSGKSDVGALYVTERPRKVWKPEEITARLHSIPVVKLEDESGEESATASAENGEPPQKAMSQLEAQIVKWYFSLTSQHKTMVAPCIFESKAVEIAQSLKLVSFHPSKTWMKQFIRRHGIWCSLSQNRSLFLEPEGGLLKYRFEVEFEAWFHVFPDSPDNIIDYYLASKKLDFRLKLKKYLATVFAWYASQTSVVSANDILKAEAQHAELIGISDADVQSVRELYRDWCIRHKHFNESVREAYNVGLPIMLPQTLKNVSLRWAFAYNFNGFTPSQFWMRRYLQLNGLFYKKDEVVKWYRLDSTSCGHGVFDNIFRVWEGATAKGNQHLKEILDQKFRENVETPLNKVANLPEEPETPLQIVQTFTLWNGVQSTSL